MIISITCPYCGFTHTQSVNADGPQLMVCDLDEGGCDKTFVIRIKVEATAVTSKIEGEE